MKTGSVEIRCLMRSSPAGQKRASAMTMWQSRRQGSTGDVSAGIATGNEGMRGSGGSRYSGWNESAVTRPLSRGRGPLLNVK